jgi:hypothetical protein
MSTSDFLKARAQAYADNIIAALLFVGGAVVIGYLTNHYAIVLGLDTKVALVLAWALALLVFVALSLLLKPKIKAAAEQSSPAQLTQSGISIDNAPHNEFKPQNVFNPQNTFVVQMPHSETQAGTRQQPQTTKPPVLEARPAELLRTKVDINTLEVANLYTLLHGSPREQAETYVAFAKFHRDADGSEDAWVEVKGYAEFFDAKGDSLFIADKLFWWQKEGDHSTDESFRVGDTEKVIVAIVSGTKVFPYSGHYVTVDRHVIRDVTEFVLETRDHPLEGEEFLVRVVLIGTKGERQTLKQSFDYYLSPHPKAAFKLKEKVELDWARAREELLPLLREGQQLERQIPDAIHDRTRTIYFKYHAWSEQVDRALKLYLDESFTARFHAQDAEAGDTWTAELQGRVVELEKIIREL